MTRMQIIVRLEEMAEEMRAKGRSEGFRYNVIVTNYTKPQWETDRTYFKIIETRDYCGHYVIKDYGYIDNVTGRYHPGSAGI